MTRRLDEFAKNFPGQRIPADVDRLLSFDRNAEGWYSGRFELTDWEYGDPSWFGGNVDAARQFAVFGQGPDGSLYAFWLYRDSEPATSPVVFLGSEGSDCAVLANDFAEFLSLLALGETELGFAAARRHFSGPEYAEEEAGLESFRKWLWNEFGVAAPADPLATIDAAQARHPRLQEWIDQMIFSGGS